MISNEKVLELVNKKFPGTKFAKKRIEETDYSYVINTATEKYMETGNFRDMMIGGGPIVILKDSGEVYEYGSNPVNFGMINAKTLEEFNKEKQAFEEKYLKGKSFKPQEIIE